MDIGTRTDRKVTIHGYCLIIIVQDACKFDYVPFVSSVDSQNGWPSKSLLIIAATSS